MLVGSNASLPLELTETLVESAIDECERFYTVFQFVLWGGKSPAEALAASLIETRGEASGRRTVDRPLARRPRFRGVKVRQAHRQVVQARRDTARPFGTTPHRTGPTPKPI